MNNLDKKLNYIFFGCTNYSKSLLSFLIQNNLFPLAIFSIPEEFNISYSASKVKNTNYANLSEIANQHKIPFYIVDSIDGIKTIDYFDIIRSYNADLILVLGWYYMVPKKIRDLAKYGAWGIHASLLPKYAGGAPLNWAIINGETETGVTIFRMEDGVDDGDIIDQKSFIIEFEDTIKEVYHKATLASKELLLKALLNIQSVEFKKQEKSRIEIYPQRKPSDGEIDFQKPAIDIYNFIRAQSDPYPGAFFKTIDGKKIIIEKARIAE
jgi:methionyl-tRNA formyltransferase